MTLLLTLLIHALPVQAAAPCPAGQSEPMFSEILTDEPTMAAFIVKLQTAVASDDRLSPHHREDIAPQQVTRCGCGRYQARTRIERRRRVRGRTAG